MTKQRHAQAHWLRIQAQEAVKVAMTEETDFAHDSIEARIQVWKDEAHHYDLKRRLTKERNHILQCAAENLTEAEAIHRELTKL